MSQFLKPDNIWTYKTIKHLKIINFCTPLNFTWFIIVPFIFTQLDDLCVYTKNILRTDKIKNTIKMPSFIPSFLLSG